MVEELPIFKQMKALRMDLRGCIEAIAEGSSSIQTCCDSNGIASEEALNKYIEKMPFLQKLLEAAKELNRIKKESKAEDAMIQRGVDGVDEPLVNNLGQICGYKKVYSDSLLQMHLKTINPEKYSKPDNKLLSKGITLNVTLGLRTPEQQVQKRILDSDLFKSLERETAENAINDDLNTMPEQI
jgi:hypothetical protein